MNDTNEKSKKRHSHHRRKSPNDFAREVTVLVVIAVVCTVAFVFAINKPACDFVHKLENAMPMQVRDLVIDDNQNYANLEKDDIGYGTLVGNVTVEKRGVNSPVYYGLNRASLRNGVGISSNGDKKPFISGKCEVIGGYDETYFKSLKFVQVGDKVAFTSKDKIISYKAVDCFVEAKEDIKADDYNCDLVLYSIYSNYSENSGKCFIVLLDKIGEEVNANEQ